MAYIEVYDEYNTLINEKVKLQKRLSKLKKGYISTKTISNKKYPYLQDRIDGKLVSEYIREYQLHQVKDELDERTCAVVRINEIDNRLDKIEAAARFLDTGLHKKLIILRRCATMESLPLEKRAGALSFSHAITALEGIEVSPNIETELSDWSRGEFDFQESFLNTLQNYRLVEA